MAIAAALLASGAAIAGCGGARSNSGARESGSTRSASHAASERRSHIRQAAHRGAPVRIPLPRLVGQLIVGRFAGPAPSSSFLARLRAGQLGGVILFGDNTAAGPQTTRRAILKMQAAARQGGNPPLLVMTDQEGGEVRRLPGPPVLPPAAMGSAAVARGQGLAAGRLLRSVGINVDLAPVADVERLPGSFLGTRAFGADPALVADRACAFAAGLASTGVAYTLKHFPGLGRAAASTDLRSVAVLAPPAELRTDYAAYRRCGASPEALIMISTATYPTLAGAAPAVMTPEIYIQEIPRATGRARRVTISDTLDSPALATVNAPVRHAIDAGLDLALFANAEGDSATAYTRLLADARRGLVPLARLRAAVEAVEALKRRVAR